MQVHAKQKVFQIFIILKESWKENKFGVKIENVKVKFNLMENTTFFLFSFFFFSVFFFFFPFLFFFFSTHLALWLQAQAKKKLWAENANVASDILPHFICYSFALLIFLIMCL